MKLFQIEEPEGGPLDAEAPGAAIGIDASTALVEVATAVGGNAVILSDREGFEQVISVRPADAAVEEWQELFAAARLRGERALLRPVTHAVVVLADVADADIAARVTAAAAAAGLTALRLVAASELPSGKAAALEAAILAEDLAPRPAPDIG